MCLQFLSVHIFGDILYKTGLNHNMFGRKQLKMYVALFFISIDLTSEIQGIFEKECITAF